VSIKRFLEKLENSTHVRILPMLSIYVTSKFQRSDSSLKITVARHAQETKNAAM